MFWNETAVELVALTKDKGELETMILKKWNMQGRLSACIT